MAILSAPVVRMAGAGRDARPVEGAGCAARHPRSPVGIAAVILIACAGTWWSVQMAWADRLSRSAEVADRERATRLAPGSAAIRERFALALDAAGRDPLPEFRRAAELEPGSAPRFEQLGQRAEFTGDLALAERSLLRAAELSRLYAPRYVLAQFYFRRGDAAGWERWSREAFAIAPGDVLALVELASHMTPDPRALARQAMDMRPAVARQFLFYMVKNRQAAEATALARQLAESGGAAEVPPLLGFCEQLLSDGAVAPALEVWTTLCRRRLLPYTPPDPASPVTNGRFASKPLHSGFDWHVEQKFTWQYVPLSRGAMYRVTKGARLFVPEGPTWQELPQAETFRAPADVARLVAPEGAHDIRLELVP